MFSAMKFGLSAMPNHRSVPYSTRSVQIAALVGTRNEELQMSFYCDPPNTGTRKLIYQDLPLIRRILSTFVFFYRPAQSSIYAPMKATSFESDFSNLFEGLEKWSLLGGAIVTNCGTDGKQKAIEPPPKSFSIALHVERSCLVVIVSTVSKTPTIVR